MADRRRSREPESEDRLGAWLPEPGTVVTVGGEEWSQTWTSRIEHRDGASLVVVAPTLGPGEPLDAAPGTPIVLGWATEAGYLEADGVLTGHSVDVVLTWEVDANRVRRQQRRAAFRLRVALPVAVLPDTSDGRLVAVAETPSQGRTRDLSEVGLRCVLPEELTPEVGDQVIVSVQLPGESEPVTSRAEVVRVSEAHRGEVEAGLAFAEVDVERADRVRRFVFAEQLERRAGRRG